MECRNPCYFDDGELCDACGAHLYEVAIQSALNMGAAEVFYCGVCGRKMKPEKFAEHVYLYPNGECIDVDA